jgi:phage shock protein C
MGNEYKKLFRSRQDRMICGVCGGLGEYMAIDPTVIRVLFVIFGLTGAGIIAYLIAAIIIPE